MKKRLSSYILILVSIIALFILSTNIAFAQDLCEAIVRVAMEQVQQGCTGLDQNSACYGYDGLSTTFVGDTNVAFNAPGAAVELPVIQSVTTTGLDVDLDEWGIAYFRVLLDDPDTPEAITILMMGDVSLENAVSTGSADAAVASDPVPITTAEQADLYSTASLDAEVLASLDQFAVALGDAKSDDGAFVRIDVDGTVGWVATESLVPNPLIDNLPLASQVAEAVPVTTQMATDIFSDPSGDSEVVSSAEEFSVLFATTLSADSAFARVEDGWVAVDALVPSPLIDGLPVQGAGVSSDIPPLRALNFETGGASPCTLAPNRIVLQSPTGQSVDLQINTIPVRVGSTVSLGSESLDGEDIMYIYTVDGNVTVFPDSDKAFSIPAGSVTYAPLAAIESGEAFEFIEPVEVTAEGEGLFDLLYFGTEILIPETLMNYPVEIEGLELDSQCVLTPLQEVEQIAAHVGPGVNRAIRSYLDKDQTYIPAETTEAEGLTWYGIETEAFGLLYSRADEFSEVCNFAVREVRTQCILDADPNAGQIGGYTGPADTRTIVLYLQGDDAMGIRPINSEVEDDGDLWFEIPYSAAGRDTLWVKGEQFQNLEGCDDLGDEKEVTDTPVEATPETNTSAPPVVGGDLTVTLTNCVVDGSVYAQTWEINSMPEGVSAIVFQGNSASRVGTANSIVTIHDSSTGVYAYAETTSGVVEANENYGAGCSGNLTSAPTVVATVESVIEATAPIATSEAIVTATITPNVAVPATAIPTNTLIPPTSAPTATTVDNQCYIQVAPTSYERVPASVLNGANGGNFNWNSPSDLENSYSGWQIWDNGAWSVGYHGNCSPLGVGTPLPQGSTVIN